MEDLINVVHSEWGGINIGALLLHDHERIDVLLLRRTGHRRLNPTCRLLVRVIPQVGDEWLAWVYMLLLFSLLLQIFLLESESVVNVLLNLRLSIRLIRESKVESIILLWELLVLNLEWTFCLLD